MIDKMMQVAPYPTMLAALVKKLKYKPGWYFYLGAIDRGQESVGGKADNGGDIRPYAPNHGPGNDPYIVPDYRDDIDRRTQFTGKVLDH